VGRVPNMWPPEGSGDSTGLLPGLGDSNTYFFHKKTQQRRQKNIVTSIQNNSRQPLETISEIKETVFHDFEQDFQQSGEGDCEEEEQEKLENMQTVIFDSDNSQLTKEISEEEIEHAVWSMEPDKALGPDGFSINFYRQLWEIVKGDSSKMMNYI
jgi:hypothetical protein